MSARSRSILAMLLVVAIAVSGCSKPAATQAPPQSAQPHVPESQPPAPTTLPTDLVPSLVGTFAQPHYFAWAVVDKQSTESYGIPKLVTTINARLEAVSTEPEAVDPLADPGVRMALSGTQYYSSKYGLETDYDQRPPVDWALLHMADPVPVLKVGSTEISVRGLVATFGDSPQSIFLHHAETDLWYRVEVRTSARDDFDAWLTIMRSMTPL